MAIFSIASVDGKLSGEFEGSSAQDAAIAAFRAWGSELQSKSKLLDRLQSQSKLESLTSVIAADATSTKATVTSELIDALATLRTTP